MRQILEPLLYTPEILVDEALSVGFVAFGGFEALGGRGVRSRSGSVGGCVDGAHRLAIGVGPVSEWPVGKGSAGRGRGRGRKRMVRHERLDGLWQRGEGKEGLVAIRRLLMGVLIWHLTHKSRPRFLGRENGVNPHRRVMSSGWRNLRIPPGRHHVVLVVERRLGI